MRVVVSMSSARPAYVLAGDGDPFRRDLARREARRRGAGAVHCGGRSACARRRAARAGGSARLAQAASTLSDLPIVLAMGATAVAGYNVLFLYGLELAPLTDGAIIVPGFAPVFAVLVGWVALGEEPRRALLGLVSALGGLVAVVDPSDHRLRSRRHGGDLHGRALGAGGSTRTSGSRLTARFGAVTATFYATAAGALMLIPFSLAERGWRDLRDTERTPGC